MIRRIRLSPVLQSILLTVFCCCFASCASLTPYEEIAGSLPAERLLMIEGQRVHVEQQGRGEPLVLIHGFAASTYEWRKIAPELAKHYRVVALDLNGFGYTERPQDVAAYSPEGQARLVLATMDALGIDSAHLMGHSFGGGIALDIAEDSPGRIDKLILVSPLTKFQKTPLIFRSAPGRHLVYSTTRAFLASPDLFALSVKNAYHQNDLVTREVSEQYRKRLLIEGYKRSVLAFSKNIADEGGFTSDFESIDKSTLIIAGRHDALIPLADLEEANDRLPRSRLVILEQSGHSAPEEQPAEFVSAVRRFLR